MPQPTIVDRCRNVRLRNVTAQRYNLSMTSRQRRRAVRDAPVGSVVTYIRVSTDEQAASGLGLDAQRAAIEHACVARDWTVVGSYTDAGVSGSTLDRPGLQAALSDVASGVAGGLVVAKLDRLSRSLLDFASLMQRSRQEGWALVALDLGIDTGTPQGELMAAVLATFSQFERRLIGERTKSALAAKKAQGVKLGRPSVMSDVLAHRFVKMRADGMSYREIADKLNDEGLPGAHGGRWHGATILRAMQARTPRALCEPSATV